MDVKPTDTEGWFYKQMIILLISMSSLPESDSILFLWSMWGSDSNYKSRGDEEVGTGKERPSIPFQETMSDVDRLTSSDKDGESSLSKEISQPMFSSSCISKKPWQGFKFSWVCKSARRVIILAMSMTTRKKLYLSDLGAPGLTVPAAENVKTWAWHFVSLKPSV